MASDGIDSNPLVLAYSIFLSLWSTLFNEACLYRQKELQFLWGTSGYEEHEQPRPQFRGVVEEDDVTRSAGGTLLCARLATRHAAAHVMRRHLPRLGHATAPPCCIPCPNLVKAAKRNGGGGGG